MAEEEEQTEQSQAIDAGDQPGTDAELEAAPRHTAVLPPAPSGGPPPLPRPPVASPAPSGTWPGLRTNPGSGPPPLPRRSVPPPLPPSNKPPSSFPPSVFDHSYSSLPSSYPPPRTSTLTPPPTPRALLEGRVTTPTTSDSGVYDGVAPPLTNPRDNFRRIERLRNEVRGIKAIQAKHERDILAFRTALESLERRVAALDVRTKREDVEERLALLGARVFHLESRAGVVTSDVLLARLSTLEEKLGRIEAVAQAVGTPKDDFTRIRGIGPKYARTLTELGVGSFADIAAWTDTDIDAFGKALGVPASRIRKSGWVASAKRLADKKDG